MQFVFEGEKETTLSSLPLRGLKVNNYFADLLTVTKEKKKLI